MNSVCMNTKIKSGYSCRDPNRNKLKDKYFESGKISKSEEDKISEE